MNDNTGSTNPNNISKLIEVGLLLPALYLVCLIGINSYEYGFFQKLQIPFELIQIEPQRNIHLFFTYVSFMAFGIFYGFGFYDALLKVVKKGIIIFLIGCILLNIIFAISTKNNFLHLGIFYPYVTCIIGIAIVYFPNYITHDRVKEAWLKFNQVIGYWLGWIIIFSSISSVILFMYGYSKGTSALEQLKNNSGHRQILRNYDAYAIYGRIDKIDSIKRTEVFTIFISESKNDTLISVIPNR